MLICQTITHGKCAIDVAIKWEGYDENGRPESSKPDVNVPLQVEKTLMGFGKPLGQTGHPVSDEYGESLRQAPHHGEVYQNPIIFSQIRLLTTPVFLIIGIKMRARKRFLPFLTESIWSCTPS